MKLTRIKRNGKAIVGVLKDNDGGTYFTVENSEKAIPCGSYKVNVCHSPRFGTNLPLIYSASVPASRGIRIHTGNTSDDSQGCIILGNACDLCINKVMDSKYALAQLMRHCDDALEIVNL